MSQNPQRIPLYGPDGRQWGYVDWGPNGFILVSLVEDPPEIRLGATHGGGFGKVSWSWVRPNGTHEEVAVLQGKLDERYRDAFYASVVEGHPDLTRLAGECTLHLRKPGRVDNDDQAVVRIFEMRHDGVVFDVPVRYSLAAVPYLRSYGGRFRVWMQDDGNLVVYDFADPNQPKPLWASRTVVT